jgi:hypothetical protein
MFGKKIEFEFPHIDEGIVETVRGIMREADTALAGQPGAAKKAWVKAKAKAAVHHLDLKKVPNFLEDPIKDAVVGVIIDVVWATVFKAQA